MRRLTLKRLTALSLLIVGLAAITWGAVAWQQARADRTEFGRRAEELQQILHELRSAESGQASRRLDGWMAENLIRGQTTEAEVRAYFSGLSEDFENLDRPPRDGVLTIQFRLWGNWQNGENLVFDFDSRTGILQDWHTSGWICGFCPHVLADDGRWRLEGKMLAGRIGAHREGPDTLLLPRLVPRGRRLGVRLANWAPETEHIDQVQLGVVPCDPGWEVDMDGEGRPYVWQETRPIDVESPPGGVSRDRRELALGEPAAGRVVVLEARNTGEFERVMRKAVLTPGAPWPPAELALRFDDGAGQELQPVGTKFLRRVVVPVPPGARSLHVSAPCDLWLVRRAWLGQGRPAQGVAWLSATEATGPEDAAGLLRGRDGRRLVLAPIQEVDLSFVAPETDPENQAHRFVLRMWGYYELLPPADEGTR
jgi:hypothetical protein